MPGRLFRGETGEALPCRPVDVSCVGLGVRSDVPVEEGELCVLDLGSRIVFLRVVWVSEDGVRAYRFGLRALDPKVDLEEVFVAKGSL